MRGPIAIRECEKREVNKKRRERERFEQIVPKKMHDTSCTPVRPSLPPGDVALSTAIRMTISNTGLG